MIKSFIIVGLLLMILWQNRRIRELEEQAKFRRARKAQERMEKRYER